MHSDKSNLSSAHEHALRTRAYFESVYPARDSSAGWARADEQRRIALVRDWIEQCRGTEVLDVGCGDGYFLEAVLPPHVRRVRVEDLVPARVAEATGRIRCAGRTVDGAVADINEPAGDGDTFDVVLAIGVTDYNSNWNAIIANLCRRARSTVIVDFPMTSIVRGAARKLWLRWHGVTLRWTTVEELRPLLAGYARDVELVNLGLNCAVRLTPSVLEPPAAERG